METQKAFRDLVREDLLVWFCRHYGYPTDGFDHDTVQRASEHDAKWFLDALTNETVARPLTMWVEPVITIGAAARLHDEFGWPKPLIQVQSRERSAFDLVAYDASGRSRIAAVVKKTDREVADAVEAMARYLSEASHDEDPPLLWALGPSGHGQVFRVERADDHGRARLEKAGDEELRYCKAPARRR